MEVNNRLNDLKLVFKKKNNKKFIKVQNKKIKSFRTTKIYKPNFNSKEFVFNIRQLYSSN